MAILRKMLKAEHPRLRDVHRPVRHHGVFTILTNGLFISSRNINNLLNQTGYIAVLAVGMTLVIVIRHIDLQSGSWPDSCGAMAAIRYPGGASPSGWTHDIVLVGLAAGAAYGYPVARLGIPSFVATLAGWLAYRGALLLVAGGTGTVIIDNKIFNASATATSLTSRVRTSPPGVHKLTLILGIIAIVMFVISQINSRRTKIGVRLRSAAEQPVRSPDGLHVGGVLGLTWVLAGYNGLSWTVVIMLIVVCGLSLHHDQDGAGPAHLCTGRQSRGSGAERRQRQEGHVPWSSCRWGCSHGAGGHPLRVAAALRDARRRARCSSSTAIAAAFIGGASPAGGTGTIIGSLIGALVYMSLTSGMNLMGTDIALQYIVRGLVLALAVIFDVTTRRQAR